MSSIITSSGESLRLFQPRPWQIHLEDLAQGLSNTCRFAGQSRHFYSVAEHSILVADLVVANGYPELEAVALMHDAAEAFIGDMVSPLKCHLPEYRISESRLRAAIADRFDLPHTLPDPVKTADIQALALERAALIPPSTPWPILQGIQIPVGHTLHGWLPSQAKRAFLERFHACHTGAES